MLFYSTSWGNKEKHGKLIVNLVTESPLLKELSQEPFRTIFVDFWFEGIIMLCYIMAIGNDKN